MKYRLSLRPFVADLALGVIGGAALWVAVAYAGSASADKRPAGRAATPASAAPADQAIRNRILLAFLRMPGARPATIHATPTWGSCTPRSKTRSTRTASCARPRRTRGTPVRGAQPRRVRMAGTAWERDRPLAASRTGGSDDRGRRTDAPARSAPRSPRASARGQEVLVLWPFANAVHVPESPVRSVQTPDTHTYPKTRSSI